MRIIIEGDGKFIGRLLKENRIRFSRKELSWHEESCEVKDDTGSEELVMVGLTPVEKQGNKDSTIVTGDSTEQDTDKQKKGSSSEESNTADKNPDEMNNELGADMYSDPDF